MVVAQGHQGLLPPPPPPPPPPPVLLPLTHVRFHDGASVRCPPVEGEFRAALVARPPVKGGSFGGVVVIGGVVVGVLVVAISTGQQQDGLPATSSTRTPCPIGQRVLELAVR